MIKVFSIIAAETLSHSGNRMRMSRQLVNIKFKHIRFSMRFIQYILISTACFWAILASLFLYRYNWDISRYHHIKAPIVETGIKATDSSYQDRFFAFKLENCSLTFGIKHRSLKEYNSLTEKFHLGDTANVYFDDYRQKENDVYFQLVDITVGKDKIKDWEIRKKNDLLIACILYGISILMSAWLWWSGRERKKSIVIIDKPIGT